MGKSKGRKKTRSPRPRPFKIPSDEHASASELHQSNDTGVRDQLAQALEKLDRRLTDLEKRLSCLEIVAPRTQVPVGASFEFDQPHSSSSGRGHSYGRGGQVEPPICCGCGQPGHFALDCPHNPWRSGN